VNIVRGKKGEEGVSNKEIGRKEGGGGPEVASTCGKSVLKIKLQMREGWVKC